jgi:alkanesulfonate monooxygenase SsuD/methylene tetrahydromethanopterin reductase-like flavin-dependent oxidoreductase (luciferase family)
LDELVEQVQLAEDLGFHSAWTAEHHVSRYGLAGASLIVMTHLAARTSRIRLGTAIVIAPLRHPLHLAEETATLDVLCGGRLDVGVGTGSPIEVEAFGVATEESRLRTREVVEMVKGLWTDSVFSQVGTFFRADSLVLAPRPVQVPHPPLFVAGVSPETIAWTAEQGFGFMTGVLPDTVGALRLRKMYLDAAKDVGHVVEPDDIPFFRYVYVDESEEKVRAEAEPAITWVRQCLDWMTARAQGHAGGLEQWLHDGPPPATSYEEFVEDRAFFGTPEQVLRRVRALRDDHGVTYFGGSFAFGTLSHASAMRSMKQFSTGVAALL